jgi:hypothetical protein
MSELSIDQLKNLGAAAAQELAGAQADVVVDVKIALDSTDDESCYFTIRIDHWDDTGLSPTMLWIELMQKLRERMQAAGDSRYPYLDSVLRSPVPTGLSA